MLKKKIITLASSLALMVGMLGTAHAEQSRVNVYYVPLQFMFNGELHLPRTEQKSFIHEGTAYVPLRFISYSLQKSVKWDGDTYTVYVDDAGSSENAEINDYNEQTKRPIETKRETFDASGLSPSEAVVYKEKVQFVFNGKTKEISEGSSFLVDNILYVSLRFLSESVGYTIGWDSASYTINADTKEDPMPAKNNSPQEEPKQAPAPAPSAAGGATGSGGSVSGGSGGGESSTNTAAIQAEAESKLQALESKCRNQLTPLADQYLTETDAGKRSKLIAQGQQRLSGCNSEFAQIISGTNGQLPDNLIQSYRSRFEEVQAGALAELMQRVLNQRK